MSGGYVDRFLVNVVNDQVIIRYDSYLNHTLLLWLVFSPSKLEF